MNFEDVLEIFDALSVEECMSIMRSNTFKRNERSLLGIKIAQKTIKDFLPTIAVIGIGYHIMNTIDEIYGKNNKHKKA